jgi:DNA-directed RNA polymerase specialized sigma24 family protein
VVAAGREARPDAQAALESLCPSYWYPIYAFIRRKGQAPEAAPDLTQDFFLHLLSGNFFERADRSRGRFRSFLLGSLNLFLAHAHDRNSARKRGGALTLLPFEISNHACPN